MAVDTIPRNNWAIRSFNKIYFDDLSSDDEADKQKEEEWLYNKDMNTEDTMSASSYRNDKDSNSDQALNATFKNTQKSKYIKTGESDSERSLVKLRIEAGKNERFSDFQLYSDDEEGQDYKPFTILLPQSENKTNNIITISLNDKPETTRTNKRLSKVSKRKASRQ